MASENIDQRQIQIAVSGSETEQPTTNDVGLFLYDFASLYEIARLATDPKYDSFRFSRFVLYRNGRHLRSADQMKVELVRLASPLELISTIVVASSAITGAIWVMVQIFEKIYNMPLNHRKLELEVRKLEREDLEATRAKMSIIGPEEAMRLLNKREAVPYIDRVAHRLTESPIQIQDFDIKIVDSERRNS
jgi:hypothetical protein